MRSRPAAIITGLVALAVLAVAGCGAETRDADPEDGVSVSVAGGTVRGVGLGDSPEDVERVFGADQGGSGYMPVAAERFTGPQAMPPGGLIRYRDFAFLASDTVFSFTTTAAGARTEEDVGIGDQLDAVRDAYDDATCGRYDYSGSGYDWCRALVGQNSVFFGGDPVASITVTRVPIPGCRPADYPEVPNACTP